MAAIIGTEVAGRTSWLPRKLVPGETVSRLVPERVDRRPAASPGSTPRRRRRRPSRRSRSRSPAPRARRAACGSAARAARPRTARAGGRRAVDLRGVGRGVGRSSAMRRVAHERSSPTISPSRIWIRRPNVPSDGRVVGDQHERGAVGGQLVQEADHLAARLRVEVAGRLVGEDDQRALCQRAGDRDPLALAAGQLRGRCVSR